MDTWMEGRQRRSFTATTSGNRSISWLERPAGAEERMHVKEQLQSAGAARPVPVLMGQLRVNQEVTFEDD
jgi:hypothetical protein